VSISIHRHQLQTRQFAAGDDDVFQKKVGCQDVGGIIFSHDMRIFNKIITPSVSKYLSLLTFFETLTVRLIQKIIANM
jgi:hypothetical protein